MQPKKPVDHISCCDQNTCQIVTRNFGRSTVGFKIYTILYYFYIRPYNLTFVEEFLKFLKRKIRTVHQASRSRTDLGNTGMRIGNLDTIKRPALIVRRQPRPPIMTHQLKKKCMCEALKEKSYRCTFVDVQKMRQDRSFKSA